MATLTTLAALVWTPWPWLSFAIGLGLLVGVGLMLTGLIRKSAGFAAAGLVLVGVPAGRVTAWSRTAAGGATSWRGGGPA